MTPACGICGSGRTFAWLTRGEWNYRKCADCSAAWLDPLPADGWAEAFYDQGYFYGGARGGYRDYLADEALHRNNARTRILLARRFGARPPGVWLDIGCAAGFTLDEARKAGFAGVGVDLSAWARAIATKRLGLDVFATLRDARRALSGPVDVVSLFQSLEHLPDPVATLRDTLACLRPDGLLLIETWDRNSLIARLAGRHWHQITPPSVLWLLDRRSLALALRQAGFRLRAILTTSKTVSAGWVLGLLAEKHPRIFGPALRVLGRSRMQRPSFSYGLGDLVSAAAAPDIRPLDVAETA